MKPSAVGATLLATSLLLAAGTRLQARQSKQAKDTTHVVVLDRIPVTVARGTAPLARLPAAFAHVGADAIGGAQATVGVDESLSRVPGIFVNNRYNFSLGPRISMRGLGSRAAFGVRGIRVLADGIPLTMPDGQTNLNNLELGTADRIEVMRGPASSLYGNAAGGVISISTEAPPARFASQVRVLGGDAGRAGGGLDALYKLQAAAGGPMGNSGGGWIASLSRMQTDGFRDFSRAEQTLLNVVARQPLGTNSRITGVVNLWDSPVAESPGALPLDSVRRNRDMAWPANVRSKAGEADRQGQVGLAFAHAMGGNRLDIATYGLQRDIRNALAFGYIDLTRKGGGLRASWAGGPAGGRFAVTAGTDIEYASDDRREFDNNGGTPGTLRRDQQDEVGTAAPFVQLLLSLAPRLDMLLGARYDAVRFTTTDRFLSDGRDDSGERTLSATSPMAGLSFELTHALHVYGNVATAFQTPTTTELINAPPATGQSCCPGGFNTNLQPQRAVSFEAGARGGVGRFDLDLAAYHMKVRHTIVPFQVADGEGREFFRNAGESRHNGLELAASTHLGPHVVSLAWTLTDFIFIDDGDPTTAYEGNQLPGVPRQHVFAGLQLRPVHTLHLDAEMEHTGRYFANDANEATAVNDAATVLNLRLRFDARIGGVSAQPFLALNNATDTRYNSSVVVNAAARRYYEPAPRRNFYLGLAMAAGPWPGS